MIRTIRREAHSFKQLAAVRQPRLNLAALVELKPLHEYLGHPQSRAVYKLLCDGLKKEHAERIAREAEADSWGALTYYVLSWADRHCWFPETFGPMGPFVIPDQIADWLARLPDTAMGFKAGDVCWECACYYPYYRQRRPGGDFLERHPWLDRPCFLCGAKIAPRYNSSLTFGLTNEQLENAPYVRKRKEMESIWAERVRAAIAQL